MNIVESPACQPISREERYEIFLTPLCLTQFEVVAKKVASATFVHSANTLRSGCSSVSIKRFCCRISLLAVSKQRNAHHSYQMIARTKPSIIGPMVIFASSGSDTAPAVPIFLQCTFLGIGRDHRHSPAPVFLSSDSQGQDYLDVGHLSQSASVSSP